MKTTTSEILLLFEKHGHQEYGENCSQLSHAVQAGLFAVQSGLDEEIILAAFLHDIGHICPLEMENASFATMGGLGVDEHDKWGEIFLESRGFQPRVVATVRNHVRSKRYLCYAETGYYDSLSFASKETLKIQGGPMSAAEAREFELDPWFMDSVEVRRLDEAAKLENFRVTSAHLDFFATLIERHLSASPNAPTGKDAW